ncbi:MAG: ATP-binding cassette domain-containing protein [Candidatus Eremiobacteraeota bacterium]|nr:ATP-binding cassette domain-containing protein [Candidatus Eremiobacteraeota bacterium]
MKTIPAPAAIEPISVPSGTPCLELRDITVRYGRGCDHCRSGEMRAQRCTHCGSVYGCRDVSLDVWPGEVLGIVGESGSGKSTVLAVSNLDIQPTSGSVKLLGDDVSSAEGKQRRRLRALALGIVYQSAQANLLMDVTAGGNVAERMLGAGWRRYDAVRSRALALHTDMELPEDRFDVPVGMFSGGMRQRVQLAKALATSPPVLLLDEPTSGLDVSVQARILDLIRRIHAEFQLAIVVVSHDLAVIRMLADRLLVMRRGLVVEHGLTDQVLEDPQHPYTQLLVSAQL